MNRQVSRDGGRPGKPKTSARAAEGQGFDPVDLTFREVTADNWDDLVRLFEAPGGPSYCWCMVWRARGEERRDTGRAARKQMLGRRVREGTPIGLLGSWRGDPVAWCSIAPRSTYRPLGGPPDPPEDAPVVWSLVCMFVPRRFRRRGVMRRLIEVAVEHAAARGADVVEAYPVDPDAPSYRFMGFTPAFRDVGFEEIGTAGYRRHVMRRSVVQ